MSITDEIIKFRSSGLEVKSITLSKRDWERLLFELHQKHRFMTEAPFVTGGRYEGIIMVHDIEIRKEEKNEFTN
jgi:hypothetical protein